MPSVVNIFVNTHNMGSVLVEQRGIVAEYEEDMVKYASDAEILPSPNYRWTVMP